MDSFFEHRLKKYEKFLQPETWNLKLETWNL